MHEPNLGVYLVGNWKRFESPIQRKKAETEVTSSDRTIDRNIDWDPTSSTRFNETERHTTRDRRNGNREIVEEGEREDDDEGAKLRRLKRKFTKRIALILNLLTLEMIKECFATRNQETIWRELNTDENHRHQVID
jgi:hypothetical protein